MFSFLRLYFFFFLLLNNGEIMHIYLLKAELSSPNSVFLGNCLFSPVSPVSHLLSTNKSFCLLPSPSPPCTPQHFCEVYNRNPASLLEEQIEGARRRVSQLQLKIQQETGGLVVSDGSHSSRTPQCSYLGLG